MKAWSTLSAAWRARYLAWQRARHWTPEAQLHFVRTRVREDHQWLGNSQVAAEICERYMKMLQSDWYSQPYEDIGQFRSRIGLDPHLGQCDPGLKRTDKGR